MDELKQIYDVDELDNIIDALVDNGVSLDILVGSKVIWHDEHKSPIVAHGSGIAIQKRLYCHRCGKRGTTVYLSGGMHRGAWCYAYNKRGQYRANLRDQDYVCQECFSKTAKAEKG